MHKVVYILFILYIIDISNQTKVIKMSAQQIKLEFNKTYATEENAVRAVMKMYSQHEAYLRFIVIPTQDGRFGVAFIGQSAIQNMVHFSGFNVIG